eukprot:TRINITY_DN159_c0_g1_i1.p1 TRINITY_DN159_c0_g1~~TRINITY_DN159_c0_g1_i1.p1  ORF type:complete len:101 (-),score=11.41 TRINITY_DN159_c0_g1_i1:161-463(-)
MGKCNYLVQQYQSTELQDQIRSVFVNGIGSGGAGPEHNIIIENEFNYDGCSCWTVKFSKIINYANCFRGEERCVTRIITCTITTGDGRPDTDVDCTLINF